MASEIKFTKQTGDKMISIMNKLERAFNDGYHVGYVNGECGVSHMSNEMADHRDSQVLKALRSILEGNKSIEAECERLDLLGKTIGIEARENKQ